MLPVAASSRHDDPSAEIGSVSAAHTDPIPSGMAVFEAS
jgi:hypothetical protein